MYRIIKARLKQGYNTSRFPQVEPVLPPLFMGRPEVDAGACRGDCRDCMDACPVGAISRKGETLSMDLGKCLFCGECARICTSGAISFSRDYRMATSGRQDLSTDAWKLATALDAKARSVFGHSLKLRQVSAGGCNACEADVNVLNTLTFDLSRFGIQFVASPRHADGVLVTGPVTKNMEVALMKTMAAIPSPKFVVAVGSCAISGGIFQGNEEVCGGVEGMLPVDLYIPGCPPNPWTILDGLLRMVGQIGDRKKGR